MRAVREAGLTRMLGVAPGPANGFTLDLIDCLERFGELIDWAMIILGPLEPWPGELVLDAAAAHGVSVITRVVDYGGLFHDDVLPGHRFAARDHRGFRPAGWVAEGRAKLELMRPYAERHGLSMLQLACLWNLAQPGVRCVAPTLIQETGDGRPRRSRTSAPSSRRSSAPGARRAAERRGAAGDPRRSATTPAAWRSRARASNTRARRMPDRWTLDDELRARGRALGDRPGARPGQAGTVKRRAVKPDISVNLDAVSAQWPQGRSGPRQPLRTQPPAPT